MNDAAYERWLSQFVVFEDTAMTKGEWEHHPANPQRKKRKPGKPTGRQISDDAPKLYPLPSRRDLP